MLQPVSCRGKKRPFCPLLPCFPSYLLIHPSEGHSFLARSILLDTWDTKINAHAPQEMYIDKHFLEV